MTEVIGRERELAGVASFLDGMSTGFRDELAVPPSLDGLVGQRLEGLGPDGEAVALYATASAQPSAGSLAAAIGPEAARDGLAAAVGAGVLVADGEDVRFVHPLLAAAAYGRASADRRRAVHTRLADVASEPEERAMHLARAAERREEVVAGVLEDAALTVSRRGAPEAAAPRRARRGADPRAPAIQRSPPDVVRRRGVPRRGRRRTRPEPAPAAHCGRGRAGRAR